MQPAALLDSDPTHNYYFQFLVPMNFLSTPNIVNRQVLADENLLPP